MSRRTLQKDTEADKELYNCLTDTPPRGFLMVAGAGSGKTTSLIKGLTKIVEKHGDRLKLKRQKVACITYTEVAANEIWADVGNHPLVHVSTIHSFLGLLAQGFQQDIKTWVAARIEEKIIEAQTAAANFGKRVQQRTRDKNAADIAKLQQQQANIGRVSRFRYGAGSNYRRGDLGHDDIIRMVPQMISERPLMRTLVRQQYPFIFVDESQDTFESVVSALKAVDADNIEDFCLGFFGDPMQQIYLTGIGNIPPSEGWATIKKPENFRCPTSVMDVANAIRLNGDGLRQTRGKMVERDGEFVAVPGEAHLFILQADNSRDSKVARVRSWAAKEFNDAAWQKDQGSEGVKVLEPIS